MFMPLTLLALSSVVTQAAVLQSSNTSLLPIHPIVRVSNTGFENLAVRSNGQILATSAFPNASIYQVDPLGILPLTRIHQIPNVTSTNGITEGKPDVFYVVSGDDNLKSPTTTVPQSYSVTELNMRGVSVLPNGSLTRQPVVKHIASLPNAALLNGIAFAGPDSDHLLVADTFRGLIWNVNICSGAVGVTLNDTTTRGPGGSTSGNAGINGIKVQNGTMYWTNTGANALYRASIDEQGNVPASVVPTLVTSNLACDDFALDKQGNAYVAAPYDVVTKVTSVGEKTIIAGSFNSTTSGIVGPTAIRFGRLVSDQWSIYVTTNAGLSSVSVVLPGSAGVSRIDLGFGQ